MWQLPSSSVYKSMFQKKGYVAFPAITQHSCDKLLEDVKLLSRNYGVEIDQEGGGVGALGGKEDRLRYRVTSGEQIAKHANYLYDLYMDPLIWQWAAEVTGDTLVRSNSVISSININLLHTKGWQYQAHVDNDPYTALLFLQEFQPWEGGGLEMTLSNGDHSWKEVIQPYPGLFILFNGYLIPHRVLPLQVDKPRYSIPMVYANKQVDRDPELDRQLFGDGTNQA